MLYIEKLNKYLCRDIKYFYVVLKMLNKYFCAEMIYDFREIFTVRFTLRIVLAQNDNSFLRELILQLMIYERVIKHFLRLSVTLLARNYFDVKLARFCTVFGDLRDTREQSL